MASMPYDESDRMYIDSLKVSPRCGSVAFIVGGEMAVHLVGGDDNAVILYPHHEIHEGRMFEVSYKTPDGSPLADNATILIRLLTGVQECHTVFGGNVGGDAQGELLEAPTINTPGAAMTEWNMNRTSPHSATAQAFLDPTITGGALLFDAFIPGGTGGNASGGSGAVRLGTEWILRPSTEYVIRLTNRAGNAQPASLAVQWYEETP